MKDSTTGAAQGLATPRAEGVPSAVRVSETDVTLVDLLVRRVRETPTRVAVVDALAAGDVTWTWTELAARAERLARRFENAGLQRGDRVAHLGPHGGDWIVVDLACLLCGVVHVAVHADAAEADDAALLDWLAPRGVVLSGGATCGDRPQSILLRTADGVATDESPLDTPAAVLAALAHRAVACDADACCTIMLSSGTTGRPHGVLHSQRGLAANALAASDMFLPDPRDVRLSWLPMSHALARVGDLYTAIVRGGCLSVVADRSRVLDACRRLPPTVILGVPAFFERLERAGAAGRITDLRAALGGGVRVCVSGGAPLRDRTVASFAAAGVPLVEGYGLAEAGPVVTLSNPRIARPGTVGPPLAGVRVRIDDRAETRGQLLVATPSRAIGTMAWPAGVTEPASVASPHAEWLETGDLAEIDEAGHVRITGRLRDTLVLSTGIKLPPAEVERVLAEDAAVAQVCVVGDGLPWPVAIVVPEPAELRAAIRRLGIRVFSRRAAVAHPRLLAWLGRRLARRQRGLPRAWQCRRCFLVGRPFDAAHGEATPSFKLKRREIAAHLHDQITLAAASPPPPWAVTLGGTRHGTDARGGREPPRMPPRPLAESLWTCGQGGHGGFEAAAADAVMPLRGPLEAVVERTERELETLRSEGLLYDPAPQSAGPRAPLDDAPDPPRGRLSQAAETALAATGLWGLAVPVSQGGTAATWTEMVRVITRLAANVPTVAGMLAVHSSIGAVSAVAEFGSPEQRDRLLPGLAAGRPLSIFGGTEPDVGCDLAAVRTRLERRHGRLLLSGTKMFITGATYGRLVKLLARHEDRLVVILARLPDRDEHGFRLAPYALHPLKHAHNAALVFDEFAVEDRDLLQPASPRDGMQIIWHGLNRGRVTLAAQAAGTLRLLLAQAAAHARRRVTWNAPIASRELVQGRLGRLAASIVACDAMAAWAAASIDGGGTGELEAIAAKVTASSCVRDGALDALGVHGGRAFLVGHPLGDSWHDHFAVTVYEGESDLLGLALFKGLVKQHPAAWEKVRPSAVQRAGRWLAWRAATWSQQAFPAAAITGAATCDRAILDRQLRGHARAARRALAATAVRIDRAVRRQGRAIAERQLEIGLLAADVRELASVLAVAWYADAAGSPLIEAAADCWCRLALARAGGRRPTAGDLAAVARVGREVSGTPFPAA
jgi:long-subunit acyl-CoA synthetase (AMP-forming)/alkylation response protein AidB-like acyl-CoA dehydrogenase